ncbi:hypothetical protein [Nonlabens xiamenensis]|uniref:hypothetical protein n=1 Tax=Nonlabens xiamenensis TaxID=2341043 RepID=UPI000F615DCE|nr:hypothetical protein [Nonlabens xiamenensis]
MRQLPFAGIILLNLLIGGLAQGQEMHLYGGENHQVYLGCLTCERFQTNSIWNAFGEYGSSFSSTSIWNDLNIYGDPNKNYSPWNPLSTNPPKILNQHGKFLGYLTAIKNHKDRAVFPLAIQLVENHQKIAANLGKWYQHLIVEKRTSILLDLDGK